MPIPDFNDTLIEEKARAITMKAFTLIEKDLGKLESGEAVNYDRMGALSQVVEAAANHIGGDGYDAADGI